MLELAEKDIKTVTIIIFRIFKKLTRDKEDTKNIISQFFKKIKIELLEIKITV